MMMLKNKALPSLMSNYSANIKACKGTLYRLFLFILLFYLFFLHNTPLYPQSKEENWLNQPISYIATSDEQQVFLGLRSSKEKEQFIKHFWQKRDPDLTTSTNEFKLEFEKRVEFANRYFSTYQKYGWMSDRGKIYILLGKPTEIERNPPQEGTPRSEVWIYNIIKCSSKLKNLRICFIDHKNDGDYKLSTQRSYGLKEIPWQRIGIEEQRFSFGFYINQEVPSDLTPNIYRLGSSHSFNISPMIDIHNVADVIHIWRLFQIALKSSMPLPNSKQKYTHILPQFQTDFFRDTQGLCYIPMTMKLYYRDFAYIKRNSRDYATMDVLALLYNKAGNLINAIGNRVSFGLAKKEKIRNLEDKSFTYQMGMIAPSGEYKLHLYILDKVTNSYKANWIKDLKVPRWKKPGLHLSSLILSNHAETLPLDKLYPLKGKQPYIFGNIKIIPNVNKTFQKRGNLSVFFQIYNTIPSSKNRLNSYKIDYIFYKGGRFFSKAPNHFPPATKRKINNMLVNFKLINFYSGNYTLEVKVTDRKSHDTAYNRIEFVIK